MIAYFLAAFCLALVSTMAVRRIAEHWGIVDMPDGNRKRHSHSVALLGGVAIFVSFWLPVLYLLLHPQFGVERISDKLVASFVVGVVLLILGIVDEIKKITPQLRLIVVALAVLLSVAAGISIPTVTNPSGGAISLGLLVGDVLAFVWLMGSIFTVKILDGLDGLATGVVFIGALVIFLLTNTAAFYQPNVGLVSLIFAGALCGFLIFNFSPAKIFLGESGGLSIGFILGLLAIISGSKIATALLVMAVPSIDLARVLYARSRRHQPLFQGDREHLHYVLVDSGWNERTVVLAYYAAALILGTAGLYFTSQAKLLVLAVVGVCIVTAGVYLKKSYGRTR